MFWLGNPSCIVLNKFIVPKEEALLGYVLKYRRVMSNEQKRKKDAEPCGFARHWALHAVVGLASASLLAPTSSFGPPCGWSLCVIDGPSHRHWAYASSLSAPCCWWALCVVDGPLIRPLFCRSTLCVVDELAVSSIGPPSC